MSYDGLHAVDEIHVGTDERGERVVIRDAESGAQLSDELVPAEVRRGAGGLVDWLTSYLPRAGVSVPSEGVLELLADGLAAFLVAGVPARETTDLVERVSAYVRRYVVLTDEQLLAVALWVLHTYAIDAAQQTPYLSLRSVEKQSGKTRLLEVLELLCPRARMWTHPSEAVTFRSIEAEQPTLLLDEIDAIWSERGNEHEGLRALLNAGARRGVTVPRCVGPSQKLKSFKTFCAKAIAGIGEPPDTIADRSIPIVMKRRTSEEPVTRFRHRDAAADAEPLAGACADWAARYVAKLQDARPELPDELSDRAQDVVEPLLAIADEGGPDLAARARTSVVHVINGAIDVDSTSPKLRLLSDCRTVIRAKGLLSPGAIATAELLEGLRALEDAPWRTSGKDGLGLSGSRLAWLLRGYGIKSKQVRSFNAKGYDLAPFEDAWARYLPSEVSAGEGAEAKQGPDCFGGEVAQSPESVETVSASFVSTTSCRETAVEVDVAAEFQRWLTERGESE
jgi:hypothetical protein